MTKKRGRKKNSAVSAVKVRPCLICGEQPRLVESQYGDFMVICMNKHCADPRRTGWMESAARAADGWNNGRTVVARDFAGRLK